MFRTEIFQASLAGEFAQVRQELANGADPNLFHKGQTALMLAAERGHATIVEMLLQNGAAVNAVDTYQRTALHVAVKFGHEACVDVLMRFGASTTIQSSLGGETAMDIAKYRSNAAIQKKLNVTTVTAASPTRSQPPSVLSASVGGQQRLLDSSQTRPTSTVNTNIDATPVAVSYNRKAPAAVHDESIRPEPLLSAAGTH